MSNFNDFLKQKGKKENPITTKKKEPQYKSVRIYPEDFREYKRIAFQQDKTIVELISEGLRYVKQKYDD